MTLLDAQVYDEARDRRRRIVIIVAIVVGLFMIWLGYHLRNFPERRVADKFFAALQQQNFETAFSIWNQDKEWKQHASKYSQYGYSDFYQDWGPPGEWGAVKSYSVDCSYSSGSGVFVQATINHRSEHTYVWVDKSDKTLHFSPGGIEIDCGNWFGWLTE